MLSANYITITGASSGIGRATAFKFAERGRNLILIARRSDCLLELKCALENSYPQINVTVIQADLTEPGRPEELFRMLERYDIETWINNAGAGCFGLIHDHPTDQVRNMLQLNVEALTICSCLFVQKYGNIAGSQLINVSSEGGYRVIANIVAYCATKAFVSVFTEGLAWELREQGLPLKAKVFAPATTETEFMNRARNRDDFSYSESVSRYCTAEQAAQLLLELYDSDRTTGIVDRNTMQMTLSDPTISYIHSATVL